MTIQFDALQSGLGACILQDKKAIAYASRAMSKAEVNYAQIEKEMLSILFAVWKFHQYIYGEKQVIIKNDHKPLEVIMKKTMNKVPPRLQRMMLSLQPYDLQVKYVPGKFMYLADALSQALLPIQDAAEEDPDLDYVVHSIIKNLPVTTSKLEEFKDATAQDSTLKTVATYCQHGWPRAQRNVPVDVRKYWHIRDTLHFSAGIVFTNCRIVVPSKLQPEMLKLIH